MLKKILSSPDHEYTKSHTLPSGKVKVDRSIDYINELMLKNIGWERSWLIQNQK